MLILGIILFLIGYNTCDGLLIIIGIPMAGFGWVLTLQVWGDAWGRLL